MPRTLLEESGTCLAITTQDETLPKSNSGNNSALPTPKDSLDFSRRDSMSHNLAQYHARSPRYILQPQDNTLVRVAGPQQMPWEESTEIKNISLTGLAFTTPPDLCPVVGEMIKIQFEVPGGPQMACFGLITRLEPLGRQNMQVSVKFHRLDMSHRIILAQSLALRMKEQQLRDYIETKKANWIIYLKQIVFLTLWVFLFQLMTGLNLNQWLVLLGIK